MRDSKDIPPNTTAAGGVPEAVPTRFAAADAPVELHLALPHLMPQPPRAFGLAGTIVAHIAIAGLLIFINTLPPPEAALTEVTIGMRSVTPLVAPPTQRPLTLPELMAHDQPAPQVQPQPSNAAPAPKPAVPQITAPARRPGAPAPDLVAEAPPVNNIQVTPQSPVFANSTQPVAAPPVIQASEQPAQSQAREASRMAFETPSGQVAAGRAPGGRVPMPQQTSISELGRTMSRPGGGGGLSVGDPMDAAPPGGGLSAPNAPTRNQSALQMLTTDTMGVDFKPYLVTILASVRRNWLAILPESARMGRRGRVQVQFAISRDGSVPKLVISSGSGMDALDRAAVAGISASNPFPPLPSEFQGPQIRLQFTFAYNQ